MESLSLKPEEEETKRSKGGQFAKKQLKKQGWEKGKGLGKQENGISEALKVKIKCDRAGVGHSSAEQFTNNWWDHLFNSSAANIVVEGGQERVQMRKLRERGGPRTNRNPSQAARGKMLYSHFVKVFQGVLRACHLGRGPRLRAAAEAQGLGPNLCLDKGPKRSLGLTGAASRLLPGSHTGVWQGGVPEPGSLCGPRGEGPGAAPSEEADRRSAVSGLWGANRPQGGPARLHHARQAGPAGRAGGRLSGQRGPAKARRGLYPRPTASPGAPRQPPSSRRCERLPGGGRNRAQEEEEEEAEGSCRGRGIELRGRWTEGN